MTADTEKTLLYVGLGALGLMIVAPGFFGQLLGRTAVEGGKILVKTGEGVVIGIGEAVGIPQTDATLCEQAIAEGRYWDASFYCPAGTFLKSAAGAVYDWAGNLVGTAPASSAPSIITITPQAGAVDIWEGIPQEPTSEPGVTWDTSA